MRAKPLPAETRRAVTVEAVIELAAERDPGEITTAAIASHMKLTQGALFRHFPSKDAIWEAVMEWVAERLLARVDRAAALAASPVAALQAIFLAHADFVAEHPGVPRMLFGELQRAEATPAKRLARTLLERYGERIRARLEAGKAAG
ncbi:TetR family transcriptional regulator, partial [Thauera phenylacetica B4P]